MQEIIYINAQKRKIEIPDGKILFGVEYDKDVEVKRFACDRYVGNNIDLSKCQIYVSYVTVNNQYDKMPESGAGLYHCEDVQVSDTMVTFSWLLSDNVCKKDGYVAFKIVAKQNEGDNLKIKWNTKPAFGTIFDTIPDGNEVQELYPDVINQILDRLDELENEQIQGGVSDYNDLRNIPTINGISVQGDKTLDDYDIQRKDYIVNLDSFSLKSDKTGKEIVQAYNNNYKVYVKTGTTETPLTYCDGDYIEFSQFEGLTSSGYNLEVETDIWEKVFTRETPTKYVLGGICADPTTERDTIPVRFNKSNNMAYVEAQPKDFIVTFTEDESGKTTKDKTIAEIYEAYQQGKTVKGIYNKISGVLEAISITSSSAIFQRMDVMLKVMIICIGNNVSVSWAYFRASSNSIGGVIADEISEQDTNYTVEAKINRENNRLYVPEVKQESQIFVVTGEAKNYNEEERRYDIVTIDKDFEQIETAFINNKIIIVNIKTNSYFGFPDAKSLSFVLFIVDCFSIENVRIIEFMDIGNNLYLHIDSEGNKTLNA